MPTIHSAFPAGVLITNGLGADGISGALITAAKWSLFGCTALIQLPVTSSGGGSIPLAPGEIQNFYKPVEFYDINSQYKPIELETAVKNKITVKFKFNDIENEKEYILKLKPYKMLIKVLNVVNVTDKIYSATLNEIKNKIHNISIIIKNIRLRKD